MARSLHGRSVIVAGAGLAGLTAAVELHRQGATVTVLEGRDRVGGRVLTIREGFIRRQHAEAGADFIDEEQEEICRLVHSLGLKLVPVLRSGFAFALSGPTGKARKPIDGEKAWKSLAHKLEPLLQVYRLNEQRGDGVVAEKLGSLSVAGWMAQAAIPDRLREMVVGLRGFFLADPADLSLLSLLEQVASDTPGVGRMYRISGGNDRLPAALAAILNGRLHLRHEVLAVSQSRAKVRVQVRTEHKDESWIGADYLVLAVPATKVRTLDIHPPLPPEQIAAITKLKYGRVTKTLLQFDRRFWRTRNRPLAYGTDLPMGAVWDGNEEQGARPGILCLMAGGSASVATQKLLETAGAAGLIRWLNWLGKARKKLLSVHTVSWEHDPWVQGGYAVFGPDYNPALRPWLARSHGRILFAGEHTSLRWQGYMNGAVESGLRAAAEIRVLSGHL
ncbi:MAG: flavin monoamine oxidase family protein [Nitrospiraceae bacterium]